MESVHRCATCNRKCMEVMEDVTLSPTRILIVEGNQQNRKASSDDTTMKLLIWGHSAPPLRITSPPSAIDAIVYEQTKVLLNGSIYLDEPRQDEENHEIENE
ncbi:unnamed protein product [Diamesa tonsa]